IKHWSPSGGLLFWTVVLLYTADAKIYRTVNNNDDAMLLQRTFDSLNNWCLIYKLDLNTNKCKVISYSKPGVNEIKDLGITFNNHLCFDQYINNIVAKCLGLLGFIVRNAEDFTNPDVSKMLFKAYILSRLEYTSIIWYPIYTCYVDEIKRVLRKFLKFLWYKNNGSYPDRGFSQVTLLNCYDYSSLSTRRQVYALTFLYNLIRYGVDSLDLLNKINFHTYYISIFIKTSY
ncbi:hypothetical protein BDFB_010842, partial [Asbolus verrucosus]